MPGNFHNVRCRIVALSVCKNAYYTEDAKDNGSKKLSELHDTVFQYRTRARKEMFSLIIDVLRQINLHLARVPPLIERSY